ncbi:MAG: sel1 repeat family protein [Legionella sp.]|nr:sel1 repeat family protein [Legionella sp.]
MRRMRCFKYLKIVLMSLGFLSLTACMTTSLNLRQGIYNFKVQNYREAFIRLVPEAEKGCPDAQYAVGYMYYYGQGVVENKEKAWNWIHAAAKANQPDAIAAVRLLRQERANNRYGQPGEEFSLKNPR